MDESQSGRHSTANRAKAAAARAVRSARESGGWAGWALVAVGAVLCVLGWYGVSGERFVEQQIPYLASATFPGAALIVAGVVLVAVRPSDRARAGPRPSPAAMATTTDRRIEHLYALLVEPGASGEPGEPSGSTGTGAATGPPLAVPGGTLYHRPDCPLVAGKSSAAPVDAPAVRERGLTPCRLCDPPPADGMPDAPATHPGDPRPPTG
ncbi:hypothetical protein GCM10009639_51470 [Kitasatospora putterlickiae]|uniref:Uncharacterized protein n=1 Tax=Kitasatospora putterlickiae TaxID=221725 RepID=A0ABP4J6G4_9ACTN